MHFKFFIFDSLLLSAKINNKMSKKQKYYVVWKGKNPGIYDNWKNCQAEIHGVEGAVYKSFDTLEEAKNAFKSKPSDFIQKKVKESKNETDKKKVGFGIITPSISVDAACSGNPGAMEYQGVDTADKKQIFHQGPFPLGTNNIGEFLAIVHALAFLKNQGLDELPIYSDSVTAIGWIKKKKAKTNLIQNVQTAKLHEMIVRAERWLENNSFKNPILKWETESWGEIPADFGRK
jgi:ribonuclease HI